MTILFGIIFCHVSLLWLGRRFNRLNAFANSLILSITIVLVLWVVYGLFTMEKPEGTEF